MSTRPSLVALFALLLSSAAFSQDQPKTAPLPYDPLELATGLTVVPDTPEKRELVLKLLEHARQNNGMHTPGTAPFAMKVSFNSTGTSRYKRLGCPRTPGDGRPVWEITLSSASSTRAPLMTTSRAAPSRCASRWCVSPSSGRLPAGLPRR